MQFLLSGLGSIGRRHLVNLRALRPDAEILLWRHRPTPIDPETAALVDGIIRDADAARELRPDAAILAGPATTHAEEGCLLAERGAHLLVEKPLAATVRDGTELVACCRTYGRTLLVGYTLRFHPLVRRMREALAAGAIGRPLTLRAEVGQHLADWRPGTDYRRSVSAQAAFGGGALLELSHELDLASWLLGEVDEVRAWAGSVGDLDLDVEDTAEIILRFATGAVGSVHLDMIRRPAGRRLVIAGTEGVLTLDLLAGRLACECPGAEPETLALPDAERNDMYAAELAHFLDCLAHGTPPAVPGEEALRALRIVTAARAAAASGAPAQP